MTSLPAIAHRIPLQIKSTHGIFFQEIWQHQKPLLCVANTTDKDQVIQVFRRQTSDEHLEPLVQWRAEAQSVRCHAATALQVGGLLEYRLLSGKKLGLLRSPALPLAFDGGHNKVVALQGVNGSCSTPGTWVEADTFTLKSGQYSQITLLTADPSPELLIELPVATPFRLPLIEVAAASSTSLPIERHAGVFAIKAAPQNSQAVSHSVKLEILAPIVSQPTMFLLSGRLRVEADGWRCFIRGLVVAP